MMTDYIALGLVGLMVGLLYAGLGYTASPEGEKFNHKKFLRSVILGVMGALGLPLIPGMDLGVMGAAFQTPAFIYLVEAVGKTIARRG